MKTTQKPHALTPKEIGQLMALQKKILWEAKRRGIEMSKKTAKKLAIEHFGFIDTEDYNDIQKEFGAQNTFIDGLKSALPKYRSN